jgi:uncharacterized protein
MKFSLFRKAKQQAEPEKPAESPEKPKEETTAPPEEPKQQVTQEPAQAPETAASPLEPKQEPTVQLQELSHEVAEPVSKTYLKAMPLKELSDLEGIEKEVKNGNIIILRVTPLASKSIDEVKSAVNQLYEFAESIGGDIARLGEERVVICPKNIRIWREKTPVQNDSLRTSAPTAA